jgi:SPP1 gp7 family putative phage head morphogenesis protein
MARDEGNKKTINLIDSVNDFYAQTHICNETVTDDINLADDSTDFNKDFQQWINDIYDGKPSPINQVVLKQTANHLAKGIMQGFKKPTYEHQDITMINKLLSNTWQFAGFKTLAQGVELNKLLLDENGKVRPFASFKKEAEKVGTIFNQNWLQTEYQHAIAASSAASKWVDIEKQSKALPLLQYDTAGDNKVRPEHAALDGVTRPINDSFWSSYYPPNGWNCRCTVRQLADGTITEKDKIKYPDEKAVPPMFRYNVGKDGVAFPKETPFIANATKATAAIVAGALVTAESENAIHEIVNEIKLTKDEVKTLRDTAKNEAAKFIGYSKTFEKIGKPVEITKAGISHIASFGTGDTYKNKLTALKRLNTVLNKAHYLNSEEDKKGRKEITIHILKSSYGKIPIEIIVREVYEKAFIYDLKIIK